MDAKLADPRPYLLVLTVFVVASVIRYWNWDFDDAYIVYRYAQNLVSGNGWVFNVGEHYNASTSVLNTLLIALLSLVTGDPRTAAHILGGGALLLAALCLFQLLRREAHVGIAALGAVGLVCFLAQKKVWGLETMPFLALLLLFVLLEQKGRNTWWLLGLLVLTRPDGAVLIIAKAALVLFQHRRLPWIGVAQSTTVVLPWYGFSLLYFGSLLPETLAEKTWQGHSGFWGDGAVFLGALSQHVHSQDQKVLALLVRFAPEFPGLEAISTVLSGIVRLAALVGAALLVRHRNALAYVVFFAVVQQAVYVMLNVPGYYWYFVPLDVAAYISGFYFAIWAGRILVGARWRRIHEPIQRAVAGGLAIGALLFAATTRPDRYDARDQAYEKLSQEILRLTDSGTVAAVGTGTIAYHTRLPTLDFTGLTNRDVEFISGRNNDRFFERVPAIAVFLMPPKDRGDKLLEDVRFPLFYREEKSLPYSAKPGFSEIVIYKSRALGSGER